MTQNEILREMLTERGVDWKAFDLFEQTTQWSTYNGAFVYWSRERDGKLLVETTAPTKCSALCTPAQAIAATVGNVGYGIQFADWCEFPPETMVGETVFDGGGNAIGWIVNTTVGETVWEPSREWKAWHESLRHDNPSNVREAVENILFDVIDFGSDMGPNGNVWSGVDEGDALTEKCIDGWVRSIESIAEMMTKTCRLVDNESGPDMHCTECGREVDDEYRYFMERWGYSRCPHCGRRIEAVG